MPVTLMFAWSIASAQTTSSSSSSAISTSSSSSSSSFTACPDPRSTYTTVKNSCIGGHITSYYDNNQCLTYKCVLNSDMSSSVVSSISSAGNTTGSCASHNVPNATVKLSCTRLGGTISESHDAGNCLVLTCNKASSSSPQGSAMRCIKNGCSMTCDDGVYNICPSSACSESSSSSPACIRKPSGRCSWMICGSKTTRTCP